MKRNDPTQSIEEFIASLPEESLISRRGRRSFLPTVKLSENDSLNETYHGSGVIIKQEDFIETSQPLNDLSNGQLRTTDKCIISTKKDSAKKVNLPLLKEFHERRRSKLTSLGPAQARRTPAVPTLSQPFSCSNSARKTITASPSRKLNSRKSYTYGVRGAETLTSSIKKKSCGTIESSEQLPQSSNNSKRKVPLILRRSCNFGRHINKISLENPLSSEKKSNTKTQLSRTTSCPLTESYKDCKRSLHFQKDFTEIEEGDEITKPLPIADFDAVIENVSVLGGNKTKNNTWSKSNSGQAKADRSTFFIKPDEDNNKENINKFTDSKTLGKTYDILESKIPSKVSKTLDKSSTQETLTCSQSIKKKLDVERRKSSTRIPVFNINKSEHTGSPSCIKNNRIADFKKESESKKISKGSPKALKNDSSEPFERRTFDRRSVRRQKHEECKLIQQEERTNEENTRPLKKDVSTNTEHGGEINVSMLKFMSKLENELKKQERAARAYVNLIQDFFEKRETIFSDYEETLDPVRRLRKEFEKEMKVKETGDKEVHSATASSCKNKYKFLGTPIPKKRKSLTRSVSHPEALNLTPDSKFERESRERESFHSAGSISPFTNCVGNINRRSMVPMTPRSLHVVDDMKACLNKQLQSLFN